MTIKLKRSTEEILKEKARKTDVSLSEITFLCFFQEHTKGKDYFSIYNAFVKSLNKNMMDCYKSNENFTINFKDNSSLSYFNNQLSANNLLIKS